MSLMSTSFRQSKCLTTSPLDFGLSRQTFLLDLPRSQIWSSKQRSRLASSPHSAVTAHGAPHGAPSVVGRHWHGCTDSWSNHRNSYWKIIFKSKHCKIHVLWENVVWYTSNCKVSNHWLKNPCVDIFEHMCLSCPIHVVKSWLIPTPSEKPETPGIYKSSLWHQTPFEQCPKPSVMLPASHAGLPTSPLQQSPLVYPPKPVARYLACLQESIAIFILTPSANHIPFIYWLVVLTILNIFVNGKDYAIYCGK